MKEEVSVVLKNKAEAIRKGAELLLERTRDWQLIKQYLCNRLQDIELTPTQTEKLNRYQFIYNQLVSGEYSDAEVLSLVIKTYNIEQRQAYDDMNAAREIFCTVVNVNKLFEIQLQIQITKDMIRKASELQDYKSAASLGKNLVALISLLPDTEENPADLFEGHSIEATFDPSLLGAPPVNMKEVLDAINLKRKAKINTDMFEDIPHEDIANDNPEAPL
jgi:hypothetical protein